MTHFGFENIPEAEKESRGASSSTIEEASELTLYSWRRVQFRRKLVRYHE